MNTNDEFNNGISWLFEALKNELLKDSLYYSNGLTLEDLEELELKYREVK